VALAATARLWRVGIQDDDSCLVFYWSENHTPQAIRQQLKNNILLKK